MRGVQTSSCCSRSCLKKSFFPLLTGATVTLILTTFSVIHRKTTIYHSFVTANHHSLNDTQTPLLSPSQTENSQRPQNRAIADNIESIYASENRSKLVSSDETIRSRVRPLMKRHHNYKYDSQQYNDTKIPYIFQIGFNKVGTLTLQRYFEQNNVTALHLMKRTASDLLSNMNAFLRNNGIKTQLSAQKLMWGWNSRQYLRNIDLLESIPSLIDNAEPRNVNWNQSRLLHPLDTNYQYFGDFSGYRFYQWLDRSYSDVECIFLFNYRFLHNWLSSRIRHSGGRLLANNRRHYRKTRKNDPIWISEVITDWYTEWEYATCHIIRYFTNADYNSNNNNHYLIFFDIETETSTDLSNKFKPWLDLKGNLTHSHTGTEGQNAMVNEAMRILNSTETYSIRHSSALEEIQYHCNITLTPNNNPFIII